MRQQQVGQRKRAEVVGADLQFEAVAGAALRHPHDPGIVDQEIQRFGPPSGEGAHGGQIGQVEPAYLSGPGHGGSGALAFGGVADGEHDPGADAG